MATFCLVLSLPAFAQVDLPPPPPIGGGYQRAEIATSGLLATPSVIQTADTFNPELRNYPNPFNPQTTIRFTLNEAQPVRLTVYNILGQTVQVLIDGELAAGSHEASFHADDLPSGLYLLHLNTPTRTFVRSMLLAK